MDRYIMKDYADKTWFKGQQELPQAALVTVAAIILLYLLGV